VAGAMQGIAPAIGQLPLDGTVRRTSLRAPQQKCQHTKATGRNDMRPQDVGLAARSGPRPLVSTARNHPEPHPHPSPTIVRSGWSEALPARGGRLLSTSKSLTWCARPEQATRVLGTHSWIATPASSGTSHAATGWVTQMPRTSRRPSGYAWCRRWLAGHDSAQRVVATAAPLRSRSRRSRPRPRVDAG
jgi:hypothetical protein